MTCTNSFFDIQVKGESISYIGAPRLSHSLQRGGTSLSWEMAGRLLPYSQCVRAQVIALSNGSEIFRGILKSRPMKFTGGQISTSCSAVGQSIQLRRKVLSGRLSGTVESVIEAILEAGGSADFITAIGWRTATVDQNGDPFSLRTLDCSVDVTGKYTDDALDTAIGGLAQWYIDPRSNNLIIYSQSQLTTVGTINISSLVRGDCQSFPVRNPQIDLERERISRIICARDAESFAMKGNAADNSKNHIHTLLEDSPEQQWPMLPGYDQISEFYIFYEGPGGACSVGVLSITLDNAEWDAALGGYRMPATVNYDTGPDPPLFDADAGSAIFSQTIAGVSQYSNITYYYNATIYATNAEIVVAVNGSTISTITVSATEEVLAAIDLSGYLGQSITVTLTAAIPEQAGEGEFVSGDLYNFPVSILAVDAEASCCQIDTIAGTGDYPLTTPIGDGGDAAAADVGIPIYITSDPDRNLFIAQPSPSVVRKINRATNVIETIIGVYNDPAITGTAGKPTFGIAASGQKVSYAAANCCDSSGNYYYYDENHRYIGKIDTGGILTEFLNVETYYDSIALTGSSTRITCLFFRSGFIYAVDYTKHCVLKIDITNSSVTIFAGTPETSGYTGDSGPATSATLNQPSWIAADPVTGNFYIYDGGNFVIRQIDGSGNISTWAGTGSSGSTYEGTKLAVNLDGDGGIVFESTGVAYIADSSQPIIRRIATDGTVTIFSGQVDQYDYRGDGAAPAFAWLNFFSGFGLHLDSEDTLYIADEGNNRVRQIFC